ncbi:MAG: efflux RND transporter periplasmic adaptor subunit, partial [Chitinispirillaceae bacterium]
PFGCESRNGMEQEHNHAEHAQHEHDGHETSEDHAEHENHGEDHAEPQGEHDHGDHEEHGVLELTPEGRKMADVQIAKVEKRRISRTMELPGEVGFNEDNVAHVTPRYGGIVQSVHARIGQYVKRGKVLAVIENSQTLSSYEVKAPISGFIIEKHATRGEYTSGTSIYVIANLATVWINLDVYPRYLDEVTVRSSVTVKGVGSDEQVEGTVSYITPVIDKRKRSATARVVVRNRSNMWRPGTFVTAVIKKQSQTSKPAVVNDAIQVLDGEKCLFVPAGEGFRSIPVETGVQGAVYTEITDGIALNQPYVSNGAFELKAAIVTSSLGEHAGHGH